MVFLKCLSQVQGFSIWKAIGNVALVMLVIAVPLAVVVSVAVMATT